MDQYKKHQQGPWEAAQLQTLLLETTQLGDFVAELSRAAATATGRRCGITTRSAEGPYTIAGTDAVVDELDEMQYANGDGPCLQALHTGEMVTAADMKTETRWGAYPSQATELGVQSVLSYPLAGRERTLGALNMYSFDTDQPGVDIAAAAGHFADQTVGALELALRMFEQAGLVSNLQMALTSRSTIDQAIGVLMAQQGCNATAAFELLRAASQRRNIKLRDVAAQILANTTREGAPAGGKPGRNA